ncbi:CoA transferase [Pelagibacteraceae bacterium]|nr:CoA transferase [Pelagibacteraceae bacterium]
MGVLSGYKIIELSGIGPGPLCGMLFADLGAEVIRIDRKNTVMPNQQAKYDITGRSKKSICLNLKDPNSKDILFKLIKNADALIEGFRPGVTEKLGIGPDDCLKHNEKLVYGRITGWGQSGPLAQAAGHDINYIALAGALYSIWGENKPSIPLNLIGDYGGGTMFLAFGVCAALLSANRTGKGQVVDAAMIDGVSALTSIFHSLSQSGIWNVNNRGRNLFDGGAPFYQVYETKDGHHISIGSLEPQFYKLLIEKLDLGDEFKNQMQFDKWDMLKEKLTTIFKKRTRDEWNEIFEGTDVCYAPVLSISEVMNHKHMQERNSFLKINDVTQPAPAPRFSVTPSSSPSAAPDIGQDNESIMLDIGYSKEQIKELEDKGILL